MRVGLIPSKAQVPRLPPRSEGAEPRAQRRRTERARRPLRPGHGDDRAALSELYLALGIRESCSRPRTSNHNTFSGSQFKTLKYGLA
jgi:hypothetical protein